MGGHSFQNVYQVSRYFCNKWYNLIKQKCYIKYHSEKKVFPSCSVKIATRANLKKRNLILVDFKCKSVEGASEKCASAKSEIVYRCRKGFKFTTNQGILFKINKRHNKINFYTQKKNLFKEIFRSVCRYNVWDRIPSCIPGK